MGELTNCPNCDEIFYKNNFRDVCEKCWKAEEEEFNTVYQFMRKRENRAATIEQVVEQTGVKEETVLKFIKKGRIQITQFPNFGYPCDRCGKVIRKGKLCDKCTGQIIGDLQAFEREEQRKKEMLLKERRTYYSSKD